MKMEELRFVSRSRRLGEIESAKVFGRCGVPSRGKRVSATSRGRSQAYEADHP